MTTPDRIDRHLTACAAMGGLLGIGLLGGFPATTAQADVYSDLTSYSPSVGFLEADVVYMELGPPADSSFVFGLLSGPSFSGAFSDDEIAIALIDDGAFKTHAVYENTGDSTTIYWAGSTGTFAIYPYLLAKDYYLGPSTSWVASSGSKSEILYSSSPSITGEHWSIGDAGYIGFKAVKSGTSYYGWIAWDITSPSSFSATFSGFAWESTGDLAIEAGSTTSVPEPGTGALALLALGAAGVARYRRRNDPEE